jgi:hypothetical protein
MIKIRYRDSNELSPGLHAAAERRGRSTTVYLPSGLTTAERRAALRRLRLSARMGYCPRLPAAELALALLVDRIRTSIGQAGAVFRLHPAGSTVPVMVISGGAIAFLVLSTVSIRVLHQGTAIQSSASGPLPVASAGALPISGPISGTSLGPPAGLGGGPGRGSDGTQLTQPGSGGGSPLAGSPAPRGGGRGNGASTGRGNSGSGNSGSGTSGGTTLSGGANPTPTSAPPHGAAATTPAAAVTTPAAKSSSAAPKPAPSASSSSGGGVCLNVGPLGVCLDL